MRDPNQVIIFNIILLEIFMYYVNNESYQIIKL